MVSSTAWAVELEPSDTYVLMDDVGIMPYAASDFDLFVDNVLPTQLFEYLKALINKIPLDKHYVAFPIKVNFDTNYPSIIVYIFVFDDYVYLPSNGRLKVTDAGDNKCFMISYNLATNNSGNFYMPFSVSSFSYTSFSTGYMQDFTFVRSDGDTETFRLFSAPFSDVGELYYPDISNRREVVAQYATVFGLAVFLILGILRGFWRSARGRDT